MTAPSIAARLLDSLSGTASRRGLLTIAGGLLAASPLGLAGSEAAGKNKKKKKQKRKNKKKRKNTPEPTPEPTPAPVPTPTPQPGPEVRADAACIGPGETDGIFTSVDGDSRFAQTFTALASGPLVRAELQIIRNEQTVGDYILQVGSVDAFGVPTNEVLAFTSVPSSGGPEELSTIPFTFAKPFAVEAGTQYALILTQPGSDFLVWQGHIGNNCSGRAFVSVNQTAPFTAGGNLLELEFSTFVRS